MSFLQEIVKQYPIRKSREQKDAFLRYAQAQARRMGYKAAISEDERLCTVLLETGDGAALSVRRRGACGQKTE